MTSSGKVRIYELSRDLGLENRDVLDAAEKLSIGARSHSSSISDDEAVRIRDLIQGERSPPRGLDPSAPAVLPRRSSPCKRLPRPRRPAAPAPWRPPPRPWHRWRSPSRHW
ncbi:translation initiation factor IF-2 N-terminal domain-containing protein [Cyanobium sp. ATX-6F1]|uniref:translation initiation factor IF-2 N-terminal domain-containing protein n=1 Tax=Cyanobium sp. ATX-6F1 TaxID=3137388 RepID=UPI0039BDF1A1